MSSSDAPQPPEDADEESVPDPIGADPELTPGPVQSDADREVQAENAETSLDQPST